MQTPRRAPDRGLHVWTNINDLFSLVAATAAFILVLQTVDRLELQSSRLPNRVQRQIDLHRSSGQLETDLKGSRVRHVGGQYVAGMNPSLRLLEDVEDLSKFEINLSLKRWSRPAKCTSCSLFGHQRAYESTSNGSVSSSERALLLSTTYISVFGRERAILSTPERCRNNASSLVYLINSHPGNIDKRMAIRQTWARLEVMTSLNMTYIFVIGKTRSTVTERRQDVDDDQVNWSTSSTSRDIDHVTESELFKDVLLLDSEDDYYRLNVKTVTALQWAVENCAASVVTFFKTDDDVFVNVALVRSALDDTSSSAQLLVRDDVIFGNCFRSGYPHRSPFSKWYTPYRLYPHRYYAGFCLGSAVIVRRSTAAKLCRAALSNDVVSFHIEDVYVTALLADRAGVSRKHVANIELRDVSMDLDKTRVLAAVVSNTSTFYRMWAEVNRQL